MKEQVHTCEDAELKLTALNAELPHVIDGLKGASLKDACVAYFELKKAYDGLEAQRKKLYSQLDFLSKSVIPEKFEDEGIDKLQIPEVEHSFYPLRKMTASLVAGEDGTKEAAMKWLRENGLGELISETVNAGTLASAIKSMIEETAKEPPAGVVKVNTYSTVGFSKYKPK